ncbi:hypothetical protein GA0115253_1075330 [Streptomyces sp. Termitarium-T10T-6]|nr:hypothetical protein GA0115253_1075330 [Streptomyces sp. Termitarium-T10T-6]
MISLKRVCPAAVESIYGMRNKALEKNGLVAPGEASPLRNYRSETLVHKALLKAIPFPVGALARGAFRARKDQWGERGYFASISHPVHI